MQITLSGQPGAGKTLLAEMLTNCFGAHYVKCEQSNEPYVNMRAQRHPYSGVFHMSRSYALHTARKLSGGALPTLVELIALVRDENQVFIRPAELAHEMEMHRATIDRHLAKIKELGILVPDPREAATKRGITLWRLCPFLVWRGKQVEYHTYLKTIPVNHPWWQYQEPECRPGFMPD